MHQTYASKGMCNAEHNKPGIFRRKSSTSSMRSQHQQLQSSLVVSSGQSIKSSSSSITQLPSPSPSMAQLNAGGSSSSSTTPAASCPTSPQRYYGSRKYTRSINELKQQTSLPASSTTSPIKLSSQNSSSNINNNNNNTNGTIKSTIPYSMSSTSIELHRSTSTVSGFRYRSNPTGLYSYTGSAPPSVHGSRIDLNNISTAAAAAINSNDKGSAIYLGCTPRQKSNINALSTTSKSSSSSSWSVNRSSSIGGTVGTVGGGGRGGDGTSIVGTSTSGIRGSVTNNSNINRNRSSSATKLQSNTPPISPKHTRTRRPPSAPSSMAQSRKT